MHESPAEMMPDAGERHVMKSLHRRALSIDIYHPTSVPRQTAVILLHGGGWRVGSPNEMAKYGTILAGLGYTAIAPEYRLLGEASWPAPLEDVRDAIGWVRDNAEILGIDQDKIALQGFSAGGHLALLAAAQAKVAAVVSLFAPAIFERPEHPGAPDPVAMLFGGDATPHEIRAASPISQIAAGFPPTFLLGGMDDPLTPPAVTLRLFETLVAAGTAVDLHLYHGHTHEFAALPSMTAAVQAEVALFLDRAVVDPERYACENRDLNPFSGMVPV